MQTFREFLIQEYDHNFAKNISSEIEQYNQTSQRAKIKNPTQLVAQDGIKYLKAVHSTIMDAINRFAKEEEKTKLEEIKNKIEEFLKETGNMRST